ncbi:MAG: hypothetical protein JNJ61_19205 [Anaerolineae bacterium]|nr:hypothetical protein [Anaerolineae bacterium]
MTVQTRLAQPSDADFIHSLSARVQDALTRAGSLQEIGPIEPSVIARRFCATITRNQSTGFDEPPCAIDLTASFCTYGIFVTTYL